MVDIGADEHRAPSLRRVRAHPPQKPLVLDDPVRAAEFRVHFQAKIEAQHSIDFPLFNGFMCDALRQYPHVVFSHFAKFFNKFVRDIRTIFR